MSWFFVTKHYLSPFLENSSLGLTVLVRGNNGQTTFITDVKQKHYDWGIVVPPTQLDTKSVNPFRKVRHHTGISSLVLVRGSLGFSDTDFGSSTPYYSSTFVLFSVYIVKMSCMFSFFYLSWVTLVYLKKGVEKICRCVYKIKNFRGQKKGFRLVSSNHSSGCSEHTIRLRKILFEPPINGVVVTRNTTRPSFWPTVRGTRPTSSAAYVPPVVRRVTVTPVGDWCSPRVFFVIPFQSKIRLWFLNLYTKNVNFKCVLCKKKKESKE